MSINTQNSIVIDRPVATVFNFYAREHIRNHPRWDPDLKMEQITAGPIGAGTLIRRPTPCSRCCRTTAGPT